MTKAIAETPAANERAERVKRNLASIAPCYVVNVGRLAWTTNLGNLGTFTVPACEADEPYAILCIEFGEAVIDRGDDNKDIKHVNADCIAAELVRIIQDGVDADGMSKGVFVSETEKPGEARLAKEREMFKKFQQYLVSEADTDWRRYARVDLISDAAKRAVADLRLEREWAKGPDTKVPCKFCGDPVMPNVAQCKHCGSILDHELWAKGQPKVVIHVEEGHSRNADVTSLIKRIQLALKSHFRRSRCIIRSFLNHQ